MTTNKEIDEAADGLVTNAVDTIRERMMDDVLRAQLDEAEETYRSVRSDDMNENIARLEECIQQEGAWPMRLYLADAYLASGNTEGFEQEVAECLAKSTDAFVLVSVFTFMTRLYVLRSESLAQAVQYVRETLEKNPSVAPYIRSIYIQALLEFGDFDEAYNQIQTAVDEKNPMLTIEGLELLPILMARLGRWHEQDQVIQSMSTFTEEQLSDEEKSQLVHGLVSVVGEREQVGDIQSARFLMEVARTIDAEHPSVQGYLSIGIQMPKGWWPVQ